jgi:hypothetical protein
MNYLFAGLPIKQRLRFTFGRQTPLKTGSLVEVIRRRPNTRFVLVGEGGMMKDYQLRDLASVGSSESVEDYIDASPVCIFP